MTTTTICSDAPLEVLHSTRFSETPFDPSSRSQSISSCLFSSLLIKNIVSSTAGPLPLSLQRKETFPAPRFIGDYPYPTTDPPGWSITPSKSDSNTLVVELEEKLGTGRTGIAYSARIVDSGGAFFSGSPKPTHVCIKFAMPYHCRSMAREAWFYDQLPEEQGFQGTIVPRCYGFFTSSLAGDTTIIVPWEEGKVSMSLAAPEDYNDEVDPHPDFLPEDRIESTSTSINEAYTSSSWYNWSADPKNPLVSVLVLEKLGDVFKREKDENSLAAMRNMSDLEEVMTDLTAAYILHTDVRRFNFLKTPEDSSSICPRHGHAHRHRVIDFDRSLKTDKTIMGWNEWWSGVNVDTLQYPKFWLLAGFRGNEDIAWAGLTEWLQ